MAETQRRGAGGTPGGMGEFLIGLVMAVAGGYLLTSRVVVTSGFWSLWNGGPGFGVSLIPLLFGIGLLFFNGKSVLGWLLLLGGAVVIFGAILLEMEVYFQRTSLFNTLIMMVLLVGGIGLMARGVRAHGATTTE